MLFTCFGFFTIENNGQMILENADSTQEHAATRTMNARFSSRFCTRRPDADESQFISVQHIDKLRVVCVGSACTKTHAIRTCTARTAQGRRTFSVHTRQGHRACKNKLGVLQSQVEDSFNAQSVRST